MSADDPNRLPDDDVFHILQTFRRRETIRYLLYQDGPAKMRDVAEHVAAREHGTTVADLTTTQRQRVYIPLYQSHLPKLDTAGVIEYDKPRGIVRPTDRLEQFRPYLEVNTERSTELDDESTDVETHSGRRYYETAIAASLGLLVASAANVVQLPGLTLATLITGLFALTTAVYNLDIGSREIADATDTDPNDDEPFYVPSARRE